MPTFTEPQKKAIAHQEGPCRVFAGAGSGKTKVLTERYVRLLRSGVLPERVLCCTFTKAAAEEIKSRVEKELGRKPKGWWVGTIHSQCFRIVRAESAAISGGWNLGVLDEGEVQKMLRRIVKSEGLNLLKGRDMRNIKKIIDDWRMCMIRPSEIEEKLEQWYGSGAYAWILKEQLVPKRPPRPEDLEVFRIWSHRQTAHLYIQYEREKSQIPCIDLTDQIFKTWDILDRNEASRRRWQKNFDYVLIDEFQDIDPVQWAAMKYIVGSRGNVFVVGDDDQCQPPGTLVKMTGGRQIPIELLRDSDEVVAYNIREACFVGRQRKGRSIKVAERAYNGQLLRFDVGMKSMLVTPEHRCVVRWSDSYYQDDWWAVYLMARDIDGRADWRVGWCKIRRQDNVFHPALRMKLEHADRMWLLKLYQSNSSASLAESMTSLKYRASLMPFREPAHKGKEAWIYTQNRLDEFWSIADTDRLLDKQAIERDFGIDLSMPFLTKDRFRRKKMIHVIEASNVFAGIMSMAIDEEKKEPRWEPIDAKSTMPYAGPVYSLDVQGEGTYVANDVVTHNSIYAFRGSSPEIMIEFDKDYPKSTTILLDQNFRCPQNVVQMANRGIGHNVVRHEKTFFSMNPRVEPDLIEVAPEREGEVIADYIQQLAESGTKYQDIVIIYRMNAQSLPFEIELNDRKIPFETKGAKCFYDRPQVKDLIAYMELSMAHNIKENLPRVVHKAYPPRMITREAIEQWRIQPTIDGLLKVQTSDWEKNNLVRFHDDLSRLLMVYRSGATACALLENILSLTKYEQYSRGEDDDGGDDDLAFTLTALRVDLRRHATPEKFLEHVAKTRALAGKKRKRKNAVTLSTFHGVKGLEWDHVILIGMNEGIIPHSRALSDPHGGGLEEERRLAHVGLTRTKRSVLISVTEKPSRFVQEWFQVAPDSSKP